MLEEDLESDAALRAESLKRASSNLSKASKTIYAFNAEDYQNNKFRRANDELTKTQMFNQHTFAVLLPAMTMGMSGLSLAIFWLGAHLVEQVTDLPGRLTLFGDVMVFSNYAGFVMMWLMWRQRKGKYDPFTGAAEAFAQHNPIRAGHKVK